MNQKILIILSILSFLVLRGTASPIELSEPRLIHLQLLDRGRGITTLELYLNRVKVGEGEGCFEMVAKIASDLRIGDVLLIGTDIKDREGGIASSWFAALKSIKTKFVGFRIGYYDISTELFLRSQKNIALVWVEGGNVAAIRKRSVYFSVVSYSTYSGEHEELLISEKIPGIDVVFIVNPSKDELDVNSIEGLSTILQPGGAVILKASSEPPK